MKRFIAIVVAGFLALSVGAETAHHPTNSTNGETNGLGAGGTVFYSWGFMYRRHFANNFGLSTSIGGWFSSNGGHIGNELGLLYTLAHHKLSWSSLPSSSIRVYLAGYLAWIYRRNNDVILKPANSVDLGIGAGPGLEFFFNRNFGVHIELPWMVFTTIAGNKISFRDSYPHFGGGLIYYF